MPAAGQRKAEVRGSQMEPQHIFNLFGTMATAGLGWFAKTLYDAIKSIESDLSAHKVKIAEQYVTNGDLAEVKAMVQRVLDKLDGKQDK